MLCQFQVYSTVGHTYAVCYIPMAYKGFYGSSDGKESACNAGDPSSIPESGRSP